MMTNMCNFFHSLLKITYLICSKCFLRILQLQLDWEGPLKNFFVSKQHFNFSSI